jgi:hypothetical protein
MYKKYGDISNQSDGGRPSSSIDLEERKDSDHEILVTIALLNPEARYQVSESPDLPLRAVSCLLSSSLSLLLTMGSLDYFEPLLSTQHTSHLFAKRKKILSHGTR